MTTTQAIDHFLSTLPRSPKTIVTYRSGLRLFAQIVGENAALDAESYKRFLLETRDLQPGTQLTYRGAVRSMLGRMDVSSAKLKQYTTDYGLKQGKRYPTFDEDAIGRLVIYAQKLRGDLRDLRDRAMILTLVDTGLRESEICSLRRGDINRRNERAIIVGKGDKQDAVRFSRRSLAAIDDYLRARAQLDGASGRALATLPLFARHDKPARKKVKPLGPKGAWAAFKERLEEAGIDRMAVRFHDCRHMFVTLALRGSGGNIKLAQELARHSNITTTQRYAHLNDQELDRGYDEIFNH